MSDTRILRDFYDPDENMIPPHTHAHTHTNTHTQRHHWLALGPPSTELSPYILGCRSNIMRYWCVEIWRIKHWDIYSRHQGVLGCQRVAVKVASCSQRWVVQKWRILCVSRPVCFYAWNLCRNRKNAQGKGAKRSSEFSSTDSKRYISSQVWGNDLM